MHSNEDDNWFITKRNGGAYGEVSVKKEHIYVVKRIYHQNKENFKNIPEILGLNGRYPNRHPKDRFLHLC